MGKKEKAKVEKEKKKYMKIRKEIKWYKDVTSDLLYGRHKYNCTFISFHKVMSWLCSLYILYNHQKRRELFFNQMKS